LETAAIAQDLERPYLCIKIFSILQIDKRRWWKEKIHSPSDEFLESSDIAM
jgi:hypothetical protein